MWYPRYSFFASFAKLKEEGKWRGFEVIIKKKREQNHEKKKEKKGELRAAF